MGVVYKAKHTTLQSLHALKLIRPELLGTPMALERFRTEAHQSARLRHPNIVVVDEFNDVDGQYYLRMELIEGIEAPDGSSALNLEDYIVARGGRLPASEVVKTLRDILAGLAHAHRSGVVHRDIKPANVLMAPTGAKLADFGLVKAAREEFQASRVHLSIDQSRIIVRETERAAGVLQRTRKTGSSFIGTYEYMAPEQREGKEATERSDLYAVGLIAYRMLTGFKVLSLRPLTEIVPGLDPLWVQWITRSLEPDPAGRFPNAAEMEKAVPPQPPSPSMQVEANSGPPVSSCQSRPPETKSGPPPVVAKQGPTAVFDYHPIRTQQEDSGASLSTLRRRGGLLAPWAAAAICLLAFYAIAPRTPSDPLERIIQARSAITFAMWQNRATSDFSAAKRKRFEEAFQEIRLKIMADREATGSEAIDAAFRSKIDGRPIREALQLGLESRLLRLRSEANALEGIIDQNTRLQQRQGNSQIREEFHAQLEKHNSRLRQVRADIDATEQEVAPLLAATGRGLISGEANQPSALAKRAYDEDQRQQASTAAKAQAEAKAGEERVAAAKAKAEAARVALRQVAAKRAYDEDQRQQASTAAKAQAETKAGEERVAAAKAKAEAARVALRQVALEPNQLDSPPAPKFQALPTYPSEMSKRDIEGEAVVDFIVDANGDVREARAIRSSRKEFEEPAVQAVTMWKFRPAQKAGAAVAVHLQVPIVFTLNVNGGRGVSLSPDLKAPAAVLDKREVPTSAEAKGARENLDQPLRSESAAAAPNTAAVDRSALRQVALEVNQLDSPLAPKFQLRPTYPFEMRKRGIAGEAVVDFIVDANGDVREARAVRSSRKEFEEPAVLAVTMWKFRPAQKAGAAVAVHLQVPIVFTLNEN